MSTMEEKKQLVKEVWADYIARKEANGYDYSKMPESYIPLDWCGQCNRSLRRYDDDTCDCVDWDEE